MVVGDVVEESLILELCGDSSMFTLLKIKSSYEYLEDMIKESNKLIYDKRIKYVEHALMITIVNCS